MEENAQNLEIILQDCLGRIRGGEETPDSALGRYPQIATELRPLLEAALWLQTRQAALQPRPGFISASRRRLVDQIQQEQQELPARRQSSWWESFLQTLTAGFQQKRHAVQFAVALVVVLALVLTAGGTGIARASQDALPGELLYSLKRTLEKAELALTPDEAGKAELYIENARHRLEEVQALIEEDRTDRIEETVSSFEDNVYNAISIMAVVKEKDNQKATELAGMLNSTLQEKSDTFRAIAANSPAEIDREVNRLLAVSEGTVVLMINRFALVEGTPTATPTLTMTPGIAVVIPSPRQSLPSATSTPRPKHTIVLPDPFEFSYTATLTSTISITSTVSISSDEENQPPQSQRDKEKPDKKPKKEKTRPPHPDPSRKPDKPDE